MVAANCQYMREVVLPHVLAACRKDFPSFPHSERAEEMDALCAHLAQLIAGRYVAAVSDELAALLQQGLVPGGCAAAHNEPAGVSEAVLHALLRLVVAVAELQAAAPFLLARCVAQLYESISHRHVSCALPPVAFLHVFSISRNAA